ncbi:uncharacterized protein LOC135828464 [Sycon ciliatum]|uniref:uncharacterized protein LOC135828464 n=1 Tax=Sycon ciliatum TaxID=27933 RepID=UPI0031F62F75
MCEQAVAHAKHNAGLNDPDVCQLIRKTSALKRLVCVACNLKQFKDNLYCNSPTSRLWGSQRQPAQQLTQHNSQIKLQLRQSKATALLCTIGAALTGRLSHCLSMLQR